MAATQQKWLSPTKGLIRRSSKALLCRFGFSLTCVCLDLFAHLFVFVSASLARLARTFDDLTSLATTQINVIFAERHLMFRSSNTADKTLNAPSGILVRSKSATPNNTITVADPKLFFSRSGGHRTRSFLFASAACPTDAAVLPCAYTQSL